MTYATDLGYRVGDKFKLVNPSSVDHEWLVPRYLENSRDEFTLIRDDGTDCPYFAGMLGNRFAEEFINIEKVSVNNNTKVDLIVSTSVDRKIIDKTLDIACEGHSITQVITKVTQQGSGIKQLVITIDLEENT